MSATSSCRKRVLEALRPKKVTVIDNRPGVSCADVLSHLVPDAVVKLVYYGDSYYERSGSEIGALYTEDGFRSDWGKVTCALRDGVKVEIRPATAKEHKAMAFLCDVAIERLKAQGWSGPWDANRERRSTIGLSDRKGGAS